MKITKDQYERSVKQLPKLKKAEEIASTWEGVMKAGNLDSSRVTQIELKEGKISYTTEVNRVKSKGDSEALGTEPSQNLPTDGNGGTPALQTGGSVKGKPAAA